MKGYKIPEGFVKDYNEWINNYPEDDKYAWGMNAVIEAIEAYPLEELDENPWHTGTPTEENCFYALQCKGRKHPEPYHGVVVNGKFSAISWDGDLMPLPPDLIAWQKIEPFREISGNQWKISPKSKKEERI